MLPARGQSATVTANSPPQPAGGKLSRVLGRLLELQWQGHPAWEAGGNGLLQGPRAQAPRISDEDRDHGCLALPFLRVPMCPVEGHLLFTSVGVQGMQVPRASCVPQHEAGELTPTCPHGCPGLCDGGHVPILGHSALEFRPLPPCSLLANYKLSDLYSLTSTRQRPAQPTSVGDKPPSTADCVSVN